MSFLDTIFRKGRMGRTISRKETVERLQPLLKQHVWLNHYYRRALEELETHDALANRFADEMHTARADVSKLNETILSLGHTPPYFGTDIEPDEVEVSDQGDYGILYQLLDAEREFQDALAAESDIEHQMRTRAILAVVKTNSERRLDALKEATQGRRRPSESVSQASEASASEVQDSETAAPETQKPEAQSPAS